MNPRPRSARSSTAPGSRGAALYLTRLDTPLGCLTAAADDSGVAWLTFQDDADQASWRTELTRAFQRPVVGDEHPILEQLRAEVGEYFARQRRCFAVPFMLRGTPFQRQVWTELGRIPFGQTASYQEIATRIGHAQAVRAVGRANATNRLCLLVPCHRVIARDGTLGGYGGGVWRKQRLLELEGAAAKAV